jgi:hypothetical protein
MKTVYILERIRLVAWTPWDVWNRVAEQVGAFRTAEDAMEALKTLCTTGGAVSQGAEADVFYILSKAAIETTAPGRLDDVDGVDRQAIYDSSGKLLWQEAFSPGDLVKVASIAEESSSPLMSGTAYGVVLLGTDELNYSIYTIYPNGWMIEEEVPAATLCRVTEDVLPEEQRFLAYYAKMVRDHEAGRECAWPFGDPQDLLVLLDGTRTWNEVRLGLS